MFFSGVGIMEVGLPIDGVRRFATALPRTECELRLMAINGMPSGQATKGPLRCDVEDHAFMLSQSQPLAVGFKGASALASRGRLVAMPSSTLIELRYVWRLWSILVFCAGLLAIALLLVASIGAVRSFITPDQHIHGFPLEIVALALFAIPIGITGQVIEELRKDQLVQILMRELGLVVLT